MVTDSATSQGQSENVLGSLSLLNLIVDVSYIC